MKTSTDNPDSFDVGAPRGRYDSKNCVKSLVVECRCFRCRDLPQAYDEEPSWGPIADKALGRAPDAEEIVVLGDGRDQLLIDLRERQHRQEAAVVARGIRALSGSAKSAAKRS